MLDTKNGKVVGYEHEESRLDPRRAFDSLDAYAFAMIRVEAAAQERIDRKALAALFQKLGLEAGTFELELLGKS